MKPLTCLLSFLNLVVCFDGKLNPNEETDKTSTDLFNSKLYKKTSSINLFDSEQKNENNVEDLSLFKNSLRAVHQIYKIYRNGQKKRFSRTDGNNVPTPAGEDLSFNYRFKSGAQAAPALSHTFQQKKTPQRKYFLTLNKNETRFDDPGRQARSGRHGLRRQGRQEVLVPSSLVAAVLPPVVALGTLIGLGVQSLAYNWFKGTTYNYGPSISHQGDNITVAYVAVDKVAGAADVAGTAVSGNVNDDDTDDVVEHAEAHVIINVATAECPVTHQFAFNSGASCCSTQLENTDLNVPPLVSGCDGGALTVDSPCCAGDDFVACPWGGSCMDYVGNTIVVGDVNG